MGVWHARLRFVASQRIRFASHLLVQTFPFGKPLITLSPMPRPPINQKLIAAQLRLSTATVSKSFRNHPDTKPETRAIVLAHAAKIGYVASMTSRPGLRTGRAHPSRFIGVLFNSNPSETADYAGIGYLTGLSEAARRNDISLVVHRFTGSSEQILDPEHQPAAMRDGLLDGLILIHRFDPRVVAKLAEQYACVAITHFVNSVRMDSIDTNHVDAMAQLCDHLHQLHHEKIGFLGYDRSLSFNQARFGSYMQSISRLGLSFDPRRTTNVFGDQPDFDAQATLVIEQARQGVTAWAAVSDYIGYEVSRRVSARGLRIPDDVSFTGYDAVGPLYGQPQLTTVRAPFEEMGARAFDRLVHRVDRPSQPGMQTLINCQFVPGETTGPGRRK